MPKQTPPPIPPNKKPQPGQPAPPPLKSLVPLLVVACATILLISLLGNPSDKLEKLPYSVGEGGAGGENFVAMVEAGRIKDVELVPDVTGVLYVKGAIDSVGEEEAGRKFRTYIPSADKEFRMWLQQHGVGLAVKPPSTLLIQLVNSVLPVLLVFGLIYFVFMRQMRNAGHGALSFGKSRARLLNRDTNKVTFTDVAGMSEAKEEVQEIVEFLGDPQKFTKLGGRIPKGVMLMGPPGTGKTLLAKAIAGEADVPFFSISGSDFMEMFVGVGASRVRDMFEQAKRNAPCIIFIDEIDAVGRSRFTGIGGGHDEREQTLNALLVEMDGFETKEGVIILAATNRPDVLDQALTRPGRFDRQIVIDLPLVDGREEILKIHARKLKLAEDVNLTRVARGTPGFSGADLENLLNEAALMAARVGRADVNMAILEEARDKVLWGRERRSAAMDLKEKRATAVHEAGHALVQQLMKDAMPLHKVTIIPRGMALGATMSLPEKDILSRTRAQLTADMAVMMGGRSAERLVLDQLTTGARNDLQQATSTARAMVCDYGMSDALGPQAFGENQELMFLGREVNRTQNYSEETARRIDSEIHRLLEEASETAEKIIREHRTVLDQLVDRLMEFETIDGRDVGELVEHGRVLNDDERDGVDADKARTETEGEGASRTPRFVPRAAATSWACRDRTLDLSGAALVMGIVNVTPDSFSDGGTHATTDAAVAYALKLLEEGATILDIGGESTRPGADPVPEEEELARVVPVVKGVLEAVPEAIVSVDTMKAAVARAAIEAGARIINDVSAGMQDAEMFKVAAETGAGFVLMHMKGTPADMQEAPAYDDVVGEVQSFLQARTRAAVEAGLAPDTLAVDPGIGFGKRLEDNTALVSSVGRFVSLGYPVVIGLSRKAFLGMLSGRPVEERLASSLAVLSAVVAKGVQVVRVHDVAPSVDSVKVLHGLRTT